jgi:hypothetical protein
LPVNVAFVQINLPNSNHYATSNLKNSATRTIFIIWFLYDTKIEPFGSWIPVRHQDQTIPGDSGRLSSGKRCEDFSGRKLSVLASTAVMPAGVVTFLGASMWLSSRRYGSGWKPLTFAVSICSGAVRRYPLGGVIVEPRFHSVLFKCFRWQVLVFRVLFCLYLICCVRGSPHDLVSVRPLWLYL